MASAFFAEPSGFHITQVTQCFPKDSLDETACKYDASFWTVREREKGGGGKSPLLGKEEMLSISCEKCRQK